MELLMHRFTELNTYQIFWLNNYMLHNTSVNKYDSDIIQMRSLLCNAMHSRLNVKLLNVNVFRCTCHAKCVGIISNKFVENKIWEESLRIYSDLMVCGLCRLSPVIENNMANRPRRSVSIQNPSQEACVLDGCSAFRHVRLCVCDVAFTKTGKLRYRYEHRFYCSNAITIMNTLNKQNQTGTFCKIFGVCFGGQRTCKKLILITIPSSRSPKAHEGFLHTERFYKCLECSSIFQQHAITERNLGYADNNTTCLSRYFMGEAINIRSMCRGCKLAAFCYHNDRLLVGKLERNVEIARTLHRLKLLNVLRNNLYDMRNW